MVMSTVDMLFLLKLARKIRSSKYQELSAANAAASNPILQMRSHLPEKTMSISQKDVHPGKHYNAANWVYSR